MEHIIKICKFNTNTKLLIDAFHIFLKMCSTDYIITKKAAFQLHLFQFFSVINNYKKRIIKEKPMNPWQLNQGAMVPTEQKAMTSLSSAPQDDSAAAQSPSGNVLPEPGCSVCPALRAAPGQQQGQEWEGIVLPGQRNCCPYCWSSSRRWAGWWASGSLREIIQRCHWNGTLPSLEQAQHADRMHGREDSLSSLHQPEHTGTCVQGMGQWCRVPTWHSGFISCVTTPLSLHHRHEALQVELNRWGWWSTEFESATRVKVGYAL